jgi:hypothetical protein
MYIINTHFQCIVDFENKIWYDLRNSKNTFSITEKGIF